jgi:hypothetical protein
MSMMGSPVGFWAAVKPRLVAPSSVSAEVARNSRRFTGTFYAKTGFDVP